MSHLPAEVIGNILSQLGTARDGFLASTSCKKWHQAWPNHLSTLAFDFKYYDKCSTSQLEIIITETTLQTIGLQSLSICMVEEDVRKYRFRTFSAATMVAWLVHTRDTLRRLRFHGKTLQSINILEKCGKQKLEELVLCHAHIPRAGVGLNYGALRSMSLSYVSISPLNLSLLITSCPKLEALSVIDPYICIADMQETVTLTSASLKDIFVESLHLKKFLLEADCIENLHLKRCNLELFELVGKGSLRVLHIDDSKVTDLDIGENSGNLEVLDVYRLTYSLPGFYRVISRSSKLRMLRLWGVEFNDEFGHPFGWESVFVCFPQLSELSLGGDALYWSTYLVCYPSLSQPSLGDNGSSYLQNVTVLELGWNVVNDRFSDWVSGMLQRCPSLKKLVISGDVSKRYSSHQKFLADLTTSIGQITMKYNHVDVKFEYRHI